MKEQRIKKGMKKELRPICEHIGWDNERDCEEEAEFMCQCCSSPTCPEHKDRECPYGGMGYIDL